MRLRLWMWIGALVSICLIGSQITSHRQGSTQSEDLSLTSRAPQKLCSNFSQLEDLPGEWLEGSGHVEVSVRCTAPSTQLPSWRQ